MHKEISSIHNPTVKKLVQLQEKSRERRKNQLFVIEGLREISLALQENYTVLQIFYCPEIIEVKEQRDLFALLQES